MEALLKQLQDETLEARKQKDSTKSEILQLVVSEIKTEQLSAGADMKIERVYKILQSNVNSMK